MRWRSTMLGVVLASAFGIGALSAMAMGSADLGFGEVLAVVGRRLGLISGEQVTVLADRIVWNLRAPRVLSAIAVGAVLALCGVILQCLTRNELADPYLLGVSSGASVGAVAVIVLGLTLPLLTESAMVALAAFGGAVLAVVVVLGLARGRSGTLPPSRTILAGVAVGQLCGAFTSLVIMVFGQRDVARSVMAWTLGSFAGARWESAVVLLIVSGVAVVVMVSLAGILDGFSFGEVSAQSLGVPVRSTRWALLIGTALLTAMTVAYVGPIGFIGLTVPHLVRLIVGANHGQLLPLSALAGACLMLLSDTLARSLNPTSEIPVGVVTAVIGAPMLVYLLRRQAVKS